MGVLGLAVLAFAGAAAMGANGFVAAFAGGLAHGQVRRRAHEEDDASLEFVGRGGELASLLVWFLFGALVFDVLDAAPTITILYVACSLTVVRMVPVALALVGSRLHAWTVVFIGWFGPRGLASVVFGLLAYDALGRRDGSLVIAVIGATVLTSVVAHGVSAGFLAARYSRRAAALDDDRPERAPVDALATRRLG